MTSATATAKPIAPLTASAPQPFPMLTAIDPATPAVATRLMVLAKHRRTGDEQILDVLTNSDRIDFLGQSIRGFLGIGWSFRESWTPELTSPF